MAKGVCNMETLRELIERVRDTFGVQICVHDVSGVTYSNAALNLPYVLLQHGGAYCSVVKRCFGDKRCILQKQLVMWKLRRNGAQPFFGVCNMGVCEYILPVMQQGRMLAVVFVSGTTREDAVESNEKIVRALAGKPEPLAADTMMGYEAMRQRSGVSRETLRFFAELTRAMILQNSAGMTGASGGDPYAVESVRQGQGGIVRAMIGYIESCLPGTITLSDLSAVFFMSEGHLGRLFRQEMGMSVMAYVKKVRVETAARMLRESGEPVSTIASRVGVGDANYFCRMFRSVTGCSPTEYRSKNVDTSIQG